MRPHSAGKDQLTFSQPLQRLLSVLQPQVVQADDSLLPPGGGWLLCGNVRAGRSSGTWPEALAPDADSCCRRAAAPAVAASFARLERYFPKVHSSVVEGGWVDVLRVRIKRHHVPHGRIKHQLVEKGVIGSDESFNVVLRNHHVHFQNVRVFGKPEQLAGLSEADSMQGGQVITASEDAHMAKLLLGENVPQGATAAQVLLIYLYSVAVLVHFENDLQSIRREHKVGQPLFLPPNANRTGLTGCCYWEVEWRGYICISVSYGGISRKGDVHDCVFGLNTQIWRLECSDVSYAFCHNNRKGPISSSSSVSNRVAVHVHCPAGILSFYRVSDSLFHLHSFNTIFTETLHPGFKIWFCGCNSTHNISHFPAREDDVNASYDVSGFQLPSHFRFLSP
ncbi:hypothetical protein CCH79_00018819, partial [Gambusia affinis]